jgi:hypothetical protein
MSILEILTLIIGATFITANIYLIFQLIKITRKKSKSNAEKTKDL